MNQLNFASLEIVLQRIINQLGQLLNVDWCLLRPFNSHYLFKHSIFYQKLPPNTASQSPINIEILEQTLGQIDTIEIITSIATFPPSWPLKPIK